VGVFGGDSILSQLSPFFLAKTGPQPSATIATSAPNPLGCLDGKLSQNTLGLRRVRTTSAQPFSATASPSARSRMDSGVTCVKTPPPAGVFHARSFDETLGCPIVKLLPAPLKPTDTSPCRRKGPRRRLSGVSGPGRSASFSPCPSSVYRGVCSYAKRRRHSTLRSHPCGKAGSSIAR
jgi:hypothetical protein